MNVFLTGGTGFVGRHVAGRLIRDGHQVKCLVRDTGGSGAAHLKIMGAQISQGDILDADALAGAARGCDTFIHLVGIIYERRGASFDEVHVRGTLNALAAASVAGIGRFVHMSALGTGPGAGSRYHQTKWRAEEAVRASGLDYTIFRPSMIYGPGGEFILMLMRQVKQLPLILVIGSGRYRMQPVFVEDVAACFSNALENDEAAGEVFEVGGPQALSYNEIIDTLCQLMNKRRRKIHLPVAAVWPVAWLSENLQNKPLLTTDQLRMLVEDNVCDIEPVRSLLGVDPVSLKNGLKSFI